MAASNTRNLAEFFESTAKELMELRDRLQMEAPAPIASKLYTALVETGMAPPKAADYAHALRSYIDQVNDLIADAHRVLGSASHVACAAPERAIRLAPPNSPLRNQSYLELQS